MFVNKSNRKHVLMPGPMLLHNKVDCSAYTYFGRQVSDHIHENPIQHLGTDAEKALIKGLKKGESFKESNQLICMIHSKTNCETKLTKCGVQEKNRRKILRSIYCEDKGEKRYEALVDTENEEEYEEHLAELKDWWDQWEINDTGKEPEFSSWFIKNKSTQVKETMLKPARQAAVLGYIPRQFTNNDSESLNSMIEKHLAGEKPTWDTMPMSMKTLITNKYKQIKMAVL